jgi:biotin carboxyl carrier protein
MKNYTITVNGNVYDVTVEENADGVNAAPAAPRRSPVIPKAAAAPPALAGGEGSIKIEAGAAGKVFKIELAPGASVKLGDTILILEVMKMETPVVATKDGTVASINVSVGQSVETGDLLATMNE